MVIGDGYRQSAGLYYKQGYLSTDPERVVRVRTAGDKAFLTIKGKNVGAVRAEYEYEIAVDDARKMLDTLCIKPVIEKYRFRFHYMGHIWGIDEFHGENEGLIVAEIELKDESEEFSKPDWVGKEVTDDLRYANSSLVASPFSTWHR